ncbi:MAG: HD domain-containing protein [Lachnospiraceae bacterium]|nr:HD domain-containing protein [Lachnospiraceae bacterium]
MERVNSIWRHPLYQEAFTALQEAERDRVFCRHTLPHFLDVARLMQIESLETGTELPREMIYGAALLHDIGRAEELTEGTPHHLAGARLAERLLPECGYTAAETARIREAILCHRTEAKENADPLAVLLRRADKASRNCFACLAAEDCYSPEQMRIPEIRR